ncbi:uncharacterized protein NFIA_062590 [Aspergillus fischeri NRRL 181]|uniref:Uncharacterized protein n=1 Tax=Neosartorya fischeri (strain ATCC 1020 / DSM 3700 / CBS 544.65 / FGSC A1164 / JCM 1740 / NRRL 181 / WB 181) TaxID=331117 RepID=A1D5V4_NEOFI|nr:conserved hypothetical protein [Aspergillus fischeri NRRL 181]EAW21098.1 conserved hypothetical protein [Aspergillus fischeri NRRL 181]
MATTRYTEPIPEGIPVLETRKQLNDMADQYPMGTLDDRNGGYYLLDHDGAVLAVTSDSLCEELDASMEEARRIHADNLDDGADVVPRVIAMFVRRAIIGVFDYGFVMPLGGGGCLEDKGEMDWSLLRFVYGDIIAY